MGMISPPPPNFCYILPPSLKKQVCQWIEEDAPNFDYAGYVVGESQVQAQLFAKSPGILAGVPFFNEVFSQLDCQVTWILNEGQPIPITTRNNTFQPVHCATVSGPVRKLLIGERVALNILARCSGIATQSSVLLAKLRSAGYTNRLAGTRKTTPGFRLVEKYAMLVGGCDTHRHDLSSMIMLKDNHIATFEHGSKIKALTPSNSIFESSTDKKAACPEQPCALSRAIEQARVVGGFALKIEVECNSYQQADAAVAAGADVIMLDNFPPKEARACAQKLREKWITNAKQCQNGDLPRKFLVEVSGGLTNENIFDYACNDFDVISTSSLHQGVKHVDFSLKVSL